MSLKRIYYSQLTCSVLFIAFFFPHVSCKSLCIFLLLNRKLLDSLLDLSFGCLTFFQLILHMAQTLCPTHGVDLLLKWPDLLLLKLNLFLNWGKLVSLEFQLVVRILASLLDTALGRRARSGAMLFISSHFQLLFARTIESSLYCYV